MVVSRRAAGRWLARAGLWAVLLAPAGAAAQEPPGPAAPPRRIGILLPETGPFAPLGELQHRGYKLAEAELQERGQSVQVRTFDTGPPGGDVRDRLYQQVLPWRPAVVVGPYDSQTALHTVRTLAPL